MVLAFALVAGIATASQAQAPVVRVFVLNTQVQAGNFVNLSVEATVAADAPGDAVVTVDPLGVGGNTFVLRVPRSSFGPLYQGQCQAGRQCFTSSIDTDLRLAPGDHQLPVTVVDSKGRRTSAVASFQTTPPRDQDHDGLPDYWEGSYGLSPQSAAGNDGPDGDPDGDGMSNIDEFRAGTNPREKYTRLFAEGSHGDAQPLRTCVAVATLTEPTDYKPIRVLFLGDSGRRAEMITNVSTLPVNLCPLYYNDSIADRVVAVRVEAEVPIVVERDITSGFSPTQAGNPQLANSSLGVQESSRTWYFADGHTADGMDMFLLLYNPTDAPVEADFTYVRAPSTVLATKRRVLAPGARTTVWVNQDDPEVLPSDVSVTINASAGILAERAYRFHAPGRTVPHDSVTRGATVTSTRWTFPDMDSRGPFASSLVVMNPSGSPTTVNLAFEFPDRTPARAQLTLAPGERRELTQRDLPVPPNTTFGASIESSNGVGIVAELISTGVTASGGWRRSALGAMQSGTRWVFAGRGMAEESDVVLFNDSDITARVAIRMRARGFDSIESTEGVIEVPARTNVHVPIGLNDPARTIPVLAGGLLTVESVANLSDFVALIVVERTSYWDADGVTRGRATSIIGNRVQ
jgi:hypothetical protein